MFALICLLISAYILYSLFKVKKTARRAVPAKAKANRNFEEKLPINIESRIYQAFESFYIISNSSSFKTVVARLEFFDAILWELERVYAHSHYPFIVQKVVEKYNSTYYDRHLSNGIISVILNPKSLLDNLSYKEELTFKAFLRYAKEEEAHINGMKTNKGKENRTVSLMEEAQKFVSYSTSSAEIELWYSEFLERVNNNISKYKK